MAARFFAVALTCLTIALTQQIAHAESTCAADIKALCKDVPAGGGRIQACMQEHEAQISAACKKSVDALAADAKTAAAVCRWDIGRLCSDVTPGGGKLIGCLQSHAADLSPACKKELENLKS